MTNFPLWMRSQPWFREQQLKKELRNKTRKVVTTNSPKPTPLTERERKNLFVQRQRSKKLDGTCGVVPHWRSPFKLS